MARAVTLSLLVLFAVGASSLDYKCNIKRSCGVIGTYNVASEWQANYVGLLPLFFEHSSSFEES